jgi:hypothetical protein
MKQGIINFGLWLTRLGEEKGIRPLIYNPITWGHFFVSARRCGAAFTAVLREQYPEVQSAIDVGAGTGGYVMRLKQAGVNAQGIEYSSFGRSLALLQGVELKPFDCAAADGVPELGCHDLAFTIEVGEHLPESLADAFVDSITRYSCFVIFSAAQPGQGGHGHINEQPKEYWRAKFAVRGYGFQEEATKRFSDRLTAIGYRGWMPSNVQIFRRAAN